MIKTAIRKVFPFACILLLSASLTAQVDKPTATPDSIAIRANAKIDTATTVDKQASSEIILQTIRIDAVIEKPTVTLIPKRAETDVGQVPFRARSFDKELKTKPKALSNYGEELENAKRIQKIKQVLAKESK